MAFWFLHTYWCHHEHHCLSERKPFVHQNAKKGWSLDFFSCFLFLFSETSLLPTGLVSAGISFYFWQYLLWLAEFRYCYRYLMVTSGIGVVGVFLSVCWKEHLRKIKFNRIVILSWKKAGTFNEKISTFLDKPICQTTRLRILHGLFSWPGGAIERIWCCNCFFFSCRVSQMANLWRGFSLSSFSRFHFSRRNKPVLPFHFFKQLPRPLLVAENHFCGQLAKNWNSWTFRSSQIYRYISQDAEADLH